VILLTDKPIDVAAVINAAHSPEAGAVVLFQGTVRAHTEGRRTESLVYECYEEMAQTKLAELEAEARACWPLLESVVVHRLGHVDVGETSVAIAVSAAHRQEAFAAGMWLIDRIKEIVPIWKQEHYFDGSSAWTHPQSIHHVPRDESPSPRV
jgi:molybdopterin synthase catalytic subunit